MREDISAIVEAHFRDRFPVIRFHAVGGFGEVYYAEDSDGNPRALKFYTVPKAGNPTVDAAVANGTDVCKKRERYANIVRHPNIVQIYGSGTLEEIPFVEMEWVVGLTLDELLQQGSLPKKEIQRIAEEITSAIGAMHVENIVHLDVKKDNIKVDAKHRNRVVVLDYSNAEITDATGNVSEPSAFPSSRYAPPEAEYSGELSKRTDVYMAGIILVELFTGQNPKEIKDFGKAWIDVHIPRSYKKIIETSLAENPAVRYRDGEVLYKTVSAARFYYHRLLAKLLVSPLVALGFFAGVHFQQMHLAAKALERCTEQGNTVEDSVSLEIVCREAGEKNPDSALPFFYLGESFLAQNKIADAVVAYETALRMQPGLAGELQKRAISLQARNKTKNAEVLFLLLAQTVPEETDFSAFASVLIAEGKYLEAAGALKKIKDQSKRDPEQYAAIALHLLETDPETAKEYAGIAAVMQRQYEESQRQNGKKVDKDHTAQYFFLWGDICYAQGDNACAITAYREANKRDPSRPDVFFRIASIWYEQAKFAEAAGALGLAEQGYVEHNSLEKIAYSIVEMKEGPQEESKTALQQKFDAHLAEVHALRKKIKAKYISKSR